MKKRVLGVLLASMMAAGALAGCGSSSSTSDAGSSSSQSAQDSAAEATSAAPAESADAEASSASGAATSGSGASLTFAWWGNQTRNERTQAALDLYASKNGVTFDSQPSDWDSYWSKLQTSAAGNSLPELLQMDYSYLKQFVDAGLLADLTPYVDDGTLDVSNISESIVESGSVDGKLYAVSAGVNAPALLYNKTLTDQAGVTIKDNMTVDEFEDVCRTMLEKTGTKADLPYGAADNYLPYIMRAQGVTELFNADEKKLNVDDASQFVPYFQIYETGTKEGWIIGADIHAGLTSNSVEESPLVYYSSTDTQAWCAFFWTNQMEAMVAAAPEGEEIGITTWPSPDPQKSDFLKPSQFFSVSRDAGDNEAEAVKVVNFLTNDIDANNILLGERGIPASSVVSEAISPNTSETTQTVTNFVNNVVAKNSSTISPAIPSGANEVYNACNTILDEVMYGQTSAEDAAQELFTQGNEIMSRQ